MPTAQGWFVSFTFFSKLHVSHSDTYSIQLQLTEQPPNRASRRLRDLPNVSVVLLENRKEKLFSHPAQCHFTNPPDACCSSPSPTVYIKDWEISIICVELEKVYCYRATYCSRLFNVAVNGSRETTAPAPSNCHAINLHWNI